jgi:hypothetical protein
MFHPAYNVGMHLLEHLGPRTLGRLEKQTKLLLKVYLAERAKDPSSRGTESSRSNLIALRHTITQMYGESEVCRLQQPTFSFPQP